jgi:hypothetical protein
MTDKLDSNHSKKSASKKGEGAPNVSLTILPSNNKDYPMSHSAAELVSDSTDNSMGNHTDDPSDQPSYNSMEDLKNHLENEQSDIPPALVRIDKKIQTLKKKKEKIQIQQALLFMKEAQKIFSENMSQKLALVILTETWAKASNSQKKEWQKRACSFRVSSPQQLEKKTQSIDATYTKS